MHIFSINGYCFQITFKTDQKFERLVFLVNVAMWTILLVTWLCGTSLAQFSNFNSFNSRPLVNQGEQAFSNFVSNPGQRDFSNFVDLPSQKLRQQQSNGRNPANLSPDCALALPSGGCISYEDVDAAFSLAARNLDYLPLKFPAEGNFTNEEVGNLGTVIHETTRILAKVKRQKNKINFDCKLLCY